MTIFLKSQIHPNTYLLRLQMELDAICPICIDWFDDPVILRCSHNACRRCAEGLLMLSPLVDKVAVKDAGMKYVGGREYRRVTCPVCRDDSVVDASPSAITASDGATLSVGTVFKRNILLRDIVLKLQDENCVRGGKVLCGWCEGKAAISECLDCKSPFCSACQETVHSKPAFKSHEVVSLPESVKMRQRMCQAHGKPLDLYCSQDADAVCSHCLLVGQHQSHPCLSLKEVYNDMEKEVRGLIQNVSQRKIEIIEERNKIKFCLPHLDDSYEQICSQVYLTFSSIRNALDARQKQLLEDARRLRDERRESLLAHHRCLDVFAERASVAATSCGKLLESRSEVDAVRLKGQAIARLKEIVDMNVKKVGVIIPCIQDEDDDNGVRVERSYVAVYNSDISNQRSVDLGFRFSVTMDTSQVIQSIVDVGTVSLSNDGWTSTDISELQQWLKHGEAENVETHSSQPSAVENFFKGDRHRVEFHACSHPHDGVWESPTNPTYVLGKSLNAEVPSISNMLSGLSMAWDSDSTVVIDGSLENQRLRMGDLH